MCRFKKALPDPDFKYFSKLKALYLSEKAKYVINFTGNRSLVAGIFPALCLLILSFKSEVQPVYGFLPLQIKMYT